jgi:hypothetical protein
MMPSLNRLDYPSDGRSGEKRGIYGRIRYSIGSECGISWDGMNTRSMVLVGSAFENVL